jgi:chromosome segregation ATPase
VTRRHPMLLCLLAVVIGLSGCDRLYYGTMKKLGYEKRDILINRVKDARKAQREAQEEFKSALERFREVIEVDGGTLESKYDQLNRELQRAEKRAREVTDRVNSVKSVSDDLFREWNKELSQYADRGMRAESQRELQATRKRTEALIAAMRRSEQRIEPVLRPLRDRVLFLKHNLNAKALGAITAELTAVESSVDTLVAELQKAIAEADAYLAEMEKAQAGDAQG